MTTHRLRLPILPTERIDDLGDHLLLHVHAAVFDELGILVRRLVQIDELPGVFFVTTEHVELQCLTVEPVRMEWERNEEAEDG